MAKVVNLLLAARGNPDHGQDPDRPPFGVPDDALVVVAGGWDTTDQINASLNAACKLAAVYRDDNGLGGGNWVGGDLWVDGEHQGHFSYNGRFHQGQAGPLVRDGEFVFGKAHAQQPAPPSRGAEGWTEVLLSAIEASTDDDWKQVLALRPDLAGRLRVVLADLAPEDEADLSAGPRM